jgi:hypothetical protein
MLYITYLDNNTHIRAELVESYCTIDAIVVQYIQSDSLLSEYRLLSKN